MSVQIIGVMLDPSGGEPASGAMIEFIALAHYAGVPKGAESVQVTSSSGGYDFPLNYGRYSLKINHSGRAVDQGVAVVVNEESSKVMTIDQLLASQSPLTPPEIIYIKELTERAEAAAVSAEASKDAASESEMVATDGASVSTAQAAIAATKASEAAQSESSALDSKNTTLASEANVISLEQSAENSASSASADAASIFGVEANVTALEELARNSATESTLQADRSEAEADRAASAAGDVTWKQYASKQVDMEREREANKNLFAASGFQHYGNHNNNSAGVPVNEGLYTGLTTPNNLFMGRGAGTAFGSSETPFPVTYIAGFVSDVIGLGEYSDTASMIKFPEAPDGTIIYDSTGDARGTGNANLNLLTEIDPKYGDVAEDQNEAVARAFEGSIKNGDFRSGIDDWVSERDAIIAATGGVLTVTAGGTLSGASASQLFASSATVGTSLTLGFYVVGVNAAQQARVAISDRSDLPGGTYSHTGYYEKGYHEVTFDVGTATLYIHLSAQNPVAGTGVQFSNVSLSTSTEEVVTERVDMFGGEFFLEEVNATNPYVYPKGMIQSQATEMNGIPTVRSNRPDTYYAVFTGDTGSTGLGVDFFAATDAEKQVMLSDKSNNIYLMNDGSITQWRMRQRTVAGAGNGDWAYTSSVDTSSFAPAFQQGGHTRVTAQGNQDSIQSPFNGGSLGFTTSNNTHGDRAAYLHTGVFTSHQLNIAYNGECYFHVWGTVPRLNQGLYHVSLNPLGSVADNSGNKWYDTTYDFNTAADCFDRSKISHD